MAASISLKSPRTGRIRRVKVGFAWTLFLFSGLLGVPLFARRLPDWGSVILALWVASLLAGWLTSGIIAAAVQTVLFSGFLGVQLWLGFKGNEITARALLERGWAVLDRDDAGTRRILAQWGI